MNGVDENAHLPTEREIAAACREVQATWNRREELKRRLWAIAAPVTVQEIAGAAEQIE